MGCILNASKVAKAAAEASIAMNKNISFILAGVHGKFCEDDQVAREFIASLISAHKNTAVQLDYYSILPSYNVHTRAITQLW